MNRSPLPVDTSKTTNKQHKQTNKQHKQTNNTNKQHKQTNKQTTQVSNKSMLTTHKQTHNNYDNKHTHKTSKQFDTQITNTTQTQVYEPTDTPEGHRAALFQGLPPLLPGTWSGAVQLTMHHLLHSKKHSSPMDLTSEVRRVRTSENEVWDSIL